jgi:asparagine synthase (glutamine-hydrolysing)
MPNLVGIWRPASSQREIDGTLSRQLQRVKVPGIDYAVHSISFPGFGMALMDHGILENGPQPARCDTGRYSLLLDGEIYNLPELKRRFRNQLHATDQKAPEICLRLILSQGEQIVEQFNGLFCLALYDSEEGRLKIFSDRFAFRPLFYRAGSKELLFATELKAIAAVDPHPRQIDQIGIAELFCYGGHFRERTWLQGYLRVEPATVLTVDHKGIRSQRYWNYRYLEDAPTLDQATYFTVFGTLLDRAVERSMQGSKRIGIFLSGGYDSRAVAASIRPYHRPIPAFTFGHSESRDVRFAAMLAHRLGLEHFALTGRSPYLYAGCRAIVWRTEGMLGFAQTTSMRNHSAMKARMDIFLTGFLGEFMGSHTWPRLLLARSREQAKRLIFDRILGSRLRVARGVFNPSFFNRIFEAVRSRFEQSFEMVGDDHPVDIADSWRFICLQPRSTFQSPSVDRHLFETRAPLMDAELMDFLLSIPPHARLEQRIYKRMIAYRFPEIRDVPCTNSGLPINPHFAREYAMMVGRYLARKTTAPFQRLLTPQTPLGREFRDLDDDFRAEPQLVNNILRPLLNAGLFPEDIFNLHAIGNMIDEHYQRNGKHHETLSLLISWGLGSKFFLHDDLTDVPREMYSPDEPVKTALPQTTEAQTLRGA